MPAQGSDETPGGAPPAYTGDCNKTEVLIVVSDEPEQADSVARTIYRSARPANATELRSATSPTIASGAAPSVSSAADTAAGTILSGRYRLDALLGEGGMGVVFQATDLRMPGVSVAIKLLKPEFRERPEFLNILHESLRKVRSLPHPHIAGIYSLDSDGRNDYVVMELLQGQTLHSLLDREYARGIPLAMARQLIADLCSALAYAHDHGIIHCDIKPSNIFVTPAGRAKLFDFDIARMLRGRVGMFDPREISALTQAYATTEMERGEPADPRDDVYALACVIYEMLSGKHPFGGAGVSQARERGLRVTPLPALGRRENEALSRALNFDREDRTANVEALRTVLATVTTAEAAERGKPFLLAGVAVICALSIGMAWWYFRSSQLWQSQPATNHTGAELTHAESLAIHAAQSGIDPNDKTLRRALELLAAARSIDQPRVANKSAQQAGEAFVTALAQSPRIAHVGSTESQLQQALRLCRQLHFVSQRCEERDLSDEAPRSVALRPFVIDPSPVTNGEFSRFVEATRHRTTAEAEGAAYAPDPGHGWAEMLRGQNWRTLRAAAAARGQQTDVLPVLAMDRNSARAYCQWKRLRLPTEDEWEFSARGPAGRIFPWGDSAEPPVALPSQVVAATDLWKVETAVSPMFVSNVAEWTETDAASQPVLRGGSWLLPQPYFQRLALRRLAQSHAVLDGSFRCAMSTDSWPARSETTTINARSQARGAGATRVQPE